MDNRERNKVVYSLGQRDGNVRVRHHEKGFGRMFLITLRKTWEELFENTMPSSLNEKIRFVPKLLRLVSFTMVSNGWTRTGHGSGHGSTYNSAHGSFSVHDDEDDSPVEEVSPVKPKKPSRRATKAKKDEPNEAKEAPKEWTVEEEIALCQDNPGWKDVEMPYFYQTQGRKKSKTSETTSGSASGGLNLNEEADEAVEETQEFRPIGRDRAKAKKKAAGSSRGGSSSFVDLVADKFYNMKQKNGERRTSNNSPIQS
nr:hypothetical protein [Tanacetum cinerariifolium]